MILAASVPYFDNSELSVASLIDLNSADQMRQNVRFSGFSLKRSSCEAMISSIANLDLAGENAEGEESQQQAEEVAMRVVPSEWFAILS